jgi:hypothetical protein
MKRFLPLGLAVIVVAAAGALFFGCEEDQAKGGPLTLSPETVVLGSDDLTAVFEALGGREPYWWQTTDSTLGSVSGWTSRVTYTRTDKAGVNTLRVIDNHQWEARATIVQGEDPEGLAISPATASLAANGDMALFKASGGNGPYRWFVGINARGRIEVRNWEEALYERLAVGNNTLVVLDEDNRAAVAQITQPTVPPLAISPSSAQVSITNGTQVFRAVGGLGSYTWTLIPPDGGLLTSTNGDEIVFTAVPPAGTVILSVFDGATTRHATVLKK